MSGLASVERVAGTPEAVEHLQQCRESLTYWEDRARHLPRHQVRRRREARMMSERWSRRAAEAERAVYGRGILGAVFLLAAERRLPMSTHRTGQSVLHRTRQAALAAVAAVVAVVAVGLVSLLEILRAVVDALL
jgi:hypothetical protein